MIKKIEEIESSLAKLAEVVRTLRSERDSARSTASNLRKQLDERELELLQLDEEMQSAAKRHEKEMSAMREEQKLSEKKLESFDGRIRDLISLLPDAQERDRRKEQGGDGRNSQKK